MNTLASQRESFKQTINQKIENIIDWESLLKKQVQMNF